MRLALPVFIALTCFMLPIAPELRAQTRAGTAPVAGEKDMYIVVMRDRPLAAYSGNVLGYAATKPAAGARLDLNSSSAVRYGDFLRTQHDDKLRTVGASGKAYSYTISLNGFAAELTTGQVDTLRASADVLMVARNEIVPITTLSTPSYLGLDAPNGAWDQLGGARRAGEDVVIGVLDSGIWPENPSFADHIPGNGALPDWRGQCVEGEQFAVSLCNDKLIGARWFSAGHGGDAAIKAAVPHEYASARAFVGHGVHTAGTAAGNHRVNVPNDSGKPMRVSGMAPGARLAVYKVCWAVLQCSYADIIAGIDQAVADGVHVINLSLGSPPNRSFSALDLATLFAADAGVFIAAAGGNSGPEPGTVSNDSPWVATVAAGSHDRLIEATVKLGNGAIYKGAAVGGAVGRSPIVLAADAGLGVPPDFPQPLPPGIFGHCDPSFTYDRAKIEGRIVVCNATIAASLQSEVVASYGGVGLIRVSDDPGDFLRTSFAFVPSVHVDAPAAAAITAYVSNATNPTAQISKAQLTTGAPAPAAAGFSSRGPTLASNGDLLKPDLLAPGVNVLAASSPMDTGRDFEFMHGTSMAAPHVAGIAALLKQRYPTWSPAAIKSALMTTAQPRRNDGGPIVEFGTQTPSNPFAYGAGQVDPAAAMDPGLVYDAGLGDWLAYVCGLGQTCLVPGSSKDPSDLNYPSISIGALAGTLTVRRTVTNVGGRTAKYTASIKTPPGIRVTVLPGTFVLKPGARRTFEVKFTTINAPVNAFVTGSLTWSDGIHRVRSPIAVRPVAIAVPAEVRSNGEGINFPVGFQYTGSFQAVARGMQPAMVFEREIDEQGRSAPVMLQIPEGTTHLRAALFDEDTEGNADLDLFVQGSRGGPGGPEMYFSQNLTSAEHVDVFDPQAFQLPPGFPPPPPNVGNYFVTTSWGTASGNGPPRRTRFKVFVWIVGGEPAGNVTLTAPDTAPGVGTSGKVKLSFSNLERGVRYLGTVAYSGARGNEPILMPSPTIVSVNPCAASSKSSGDRSQGHPPTCD